MSREISDSQKKIVKDRTGWGIRKPLKLCNSPRTKYKKGRWPKLLGERAGYMIWKRIDGSVDCASVQEHGHITRDPSACTSPGPSCRYQGRKWMDRTSCLRATSRFLHTQSSERCILGKPSMSITRNSRSLTTWNLNENQLATKRK